MTTFSRLFLPLCPSGIGREASFPAAAFLQFFARPFFKKAASPRRSALLLPPLLHRLVVKTIPHGSAPCLCRLAAPQRPARHTRRLAFATAPCGANTSAPAPVARLLPSSGASAARPVVAAEAFFAHGGKTGRGGRLPALGSRRGSGRIVLSAPHPAVPAGCTGRGHSAAVSVFPGRLLPAGSAFAGAGFSFLSGNPASP